MALLARRAPAGAAMSQPRAATLVRRVPRPGRLRCRAGTDDSSSGAGGAGPGQAAEQQPADAPLQAPLPAAAAASSSSSSGNSTAPAPPPANGMYSTMAVLAGAGAAETAYLAATKLGLLGGAPACPTGGCDAVLNSPYGTLFGAPLPLFGAAAYAAVAAAAGLAAARVAGGRPVPAWLDTSLAGGVGVLATTSAALMAILATRLGGAPCLWCYASAGLSAGLLACLVAGLDARRMADAAAPGLGGTAVAASALLLGFGPLMMGSPGSSGAAELELAYAQPAVTTASSEGAVALARRLAASGAKMYGAFWCSHCYDQKQEFGAQAMADFPYVECFPEGWKKGVKIAPACEAAGVKAFPTWVIGGTVTEGQLDLQALANLLDSSTGAAAAADGGSKAAAVAAAP